MSTAVSDQLAIDLLRDLVEIPSISGQELRASTFLTCWMAARGFDACVDESGSAVGILGTHDSSAPARDIVLLGHIDTVAGHIPVRIENGELWGRGSVDAKGSLATFAAAAAGLDLPPGVRIVVIGATEEEAASSRGARLAATRYSPLACIIGEPSGAGAVTIGYKGRLNIDARILTPASHSAGPEPTAAELGVTLWQSVQELARRLGPPSPEPARVFDRIQTRLRAFNTNADGLHDTANLQIGLRLPPGVDPQYIEHEIRRLGSTATLQFTGHEHAYAGDPRSWLARSLTDAIRAAGHRPRLLLKTGTSDMNVVSRSWTCPIIAYGPGDSSLDHTPLERLPLDEYLAAIRTLRECLRRIVEHIQSADVTPLPVSTLEP